MDDSKALELYKQFGQEKAIWVTSHHEFSQQYFTLVVGILGAFIVAVSQFTNSPILMLVVLIGPFVNILICRTAISMCNRAYQAFLETVTVQAKLETTLGLVGQRANTRSEVTPLQFPQDKNMIPDRWVESRRFPTSEEFVNASMNKGSNRIVRQAFSLLAVTNFILALGVATFAVLKLSGRI